MNLIQEIRAHCDKLEKWEISPDEFVSRCRKTLSGVVLPEKEEKVPPLREQGRLEREEES